MKKKRIIAMILAGGQGTRLKELTEDIAKPAVAFGGKYRIIDFTLTNCSNSGIDTVGVLTQYEPHLLNNHIGRGSLLYLIATIPEEHRQKIYTLPSGQRKYLNQMSQLELRTVKRLLKSGQLESCFQGDSVPQADCQQGAKGTQDVTTTELSQASSPKSPADMTQVPTSPQANELQPGTQSDNATHQA